MKTMKRTDEDLALGRILKEGAHQAPENEWFTRRLLNRLPAREQRRSRLVWAVVSVVALVMCVGCWLWLVGTQDPVAFTMRDLTHYVLMSVLSVFVLWSVTSMALKLE